MGGRVRAWSRLPQARPGPEETGRGHDGLATPPVPERALSPATALLRTNEQPSHLQDRGVLTLRTPVITPPAGEASWAGAL